MSYYTSSFAMRQSRSIRRNQNAISFNTGTSRLGPISSTLLLALILCFMGLLYLTQITKQTSFSYEVNDLETRRSELVAEQQSLEVEAAKLQALERVENSDVAKGLTQPQTVDFVQ